MITTIKGREKYGADVSIRPPAIYLDHWALRLFSTDLNLRQTFLTYFKTKGTLLFSWANALEVSRNTGLSADKIRIFLTEIDHQWFPVEINPIKVIRSETASGNGNPCFSASFLEAYYPHIHNRHLSLSTIVELTQDEEINLAAQENIAKLKCSIGELFNQWRSENTEGMETITFNLNHPGKFVFSRLRQLIQKENSKIDTNDPLDFLHAVVPLAYADFVLLDKHWADLANKLKIPSPCVRVYSSKQIDKFMEDLELFDSNCSSTGWVD
jgi:hypothetical protein